MQHWQFSTASRILATAALACLGVVAGASAHAGCSRVIQVPIAPIGLSVVVTPDNAVQGVYPDVLRSLAGKDSCSFEFTAVPRARLDALYEAGKADLLIPASRSPRRDQFGQFVPLVHSRSMLISLASDKAAVRNAQELVERKDIRLALVRGFDFGPGYTQLVKTLTQQGRVVLEADVPSVARLLQSGAVDMTIMAPSILLGALQGDAKTAGLADRLRYDPIAELPWGDSGAYISLKSGLTDADRDALRELLERAAAGPVWKAFQRYYPANALAGSIKARQ